MQNNQTDLDSYLLKDVILVPECRISKDETCGNTDY